MDRKLLKFNPRHLQRARKRFGFSRAHLAAMALKNKKGKHLSADSIWRIESGRRIPRADTLATIAGALRIPIGDLFDWY